LPKKEVKVFSGHANPDLTREICEYLKIEEGRIRVERFSDGESFCQIEENVRGRDVFLVQPTCPPVNQNLVELLVMIDAFKRASAWRITTVIPYYGYGRQDRKDRPRVPISSKLVADLLAAAGTHRLITMDLHAAQIQGFFDVPHDHLFGSPVMLEYLTESLEGEEVVIVSPDPGGVERARAYAKRMHGDLAIIDKRRPVPNQAEVMNIIGDVKGKVAVIVDDMVDTAGTITKGAQALMDMGAARVQACCTHAVLSGPAIERIEESPLDRLTVTNTIPLDDRKRACHKIYVLSVAKLLGEAIQRIHEETSISVLFD
jgi:ribose-phosphate pyrophosphokinase